MKHFTRRLLTLTMALSMTGSAAALAAEATPVDPAPAADQSPAISVQLDGQALTFTDAVPQVVDQRTFLPFRAVFEAMGAEVSNADSTITAVRGDTTLTMKLGETAATVIKNGVEIPLTMDVAPYVDAGTWRTYVPVRFAAQAFDCAVGWDQDTSTAIIVDTEKLLETALEGKEFTYLEKLAAYNKKYSEGIWDMAVDLEGNVTFLGAAIPFNGTMEGAMADNDKAAVDMNIKLDLSQFIQTAAALTAEPAQLTPEEQATLDSLAREGIDMSVRFDIASGKFYVNMAGSVLADAGLDMDMDWTQLLEASKTMATDYTALAKLMLGRLTPTTASEEGYGVSYGVIKESVENVVYALSDEGFTKEGNTYTTLLDGGLTKLGLTLTMKNDAVAAYSMDIFMNISDEDGSMMSMTMTTAMDEKDQMTAQIEMDASMVANGQAMPLFGMEMTMTGGYTPGKTAPETEPPAGAQTSWNWPAWISPKPACLPEPFHSKSPSDGSILWMLPSFLNQISVYF